MKTLSSRDFQKNFGSVTEMVTAGESVRVTRYGRTSFFMIPETGDTEELLRRMAGERLSKMLREAKSTKAAKTLTMDDINALVNGK